MSSCNYQVGFGTDLSGQFGTWFRYSSTPGADTAVVEVYAVGHGYQLIVLKADRTLEWWYSWVGEFGPATAVFNSSTVVPLNTWMWVSGSINRNSGSHIHAVAQAWTITGTFGAQIAAENLSTVGSGPVETWAAVFNLGQSTSNPSLAGWPNGTPGWEISKSIINGSVGQGVISPPSADWVSGTGVANIGAGNGGFYNMRPQAVGAFSSLTDGSSNSFDLVAAMGGAQIVLPGPYNP